MYLRSVKQHFSSSGLGSCIDVLETGRPSLFHVNNIQEEVEQ